MKAALVHAFDQPPRDGTFADPAPRDGEVVIRAHASAASQLTRAVAAGKHYSSGKLLPFVPGFDGVGTLVRGGERVYFAGVASPYGGMAELVAVPLEQTCAIPDDVDDVTAAAIANPGMSSWAALTARARFAAGESVLVNGATGASGQLAVQIARHLGAKHVVATGRNQTVLAGLAADATISLAAPPEQLRETFRAALADHGVTVILDYLWGASAEALLAAIAGTGHGPSPRIRFVQIGAMAGSNISMPAAVLRSTRLELLGSGLGACSLPELVSAIGDLYRAVGPAKLVVETEAAPLADLEAAWTRDTGSRRLVLTL